MNDEMKVLLECNQLIIRDRKWNNSDIGEKAAITDFNISKLLNPESKPTLAERTHDALKPDIVMDPDLFDKGEITKQDALSELGDGGSK